MQRKVEHSNDFEREYKTTFVIFVHRISSKIVDILESRSPVSFYIVKKRFLYQMSRASMILPYLLSRFLK